MYESNGHYGMESLVIVIVRNVARHLSIKLLVALQLHINHQPPSY